MWESPVRRWIMVTLAMQLLYAAEALALCNQNSPPPVGRSEGAEILFGHVGFADDEARRLGSRLRSLGFVEDPNIFRTRRLTAEELRSAEGLPVVFLPSLDHLKWFRGEAVALIDPLEDGSYLRPQSIVRNELQGYGIYFEADGSGPFARPPVAADQRFDIQEARRLEQETRPRRFVGYAPAQNKLWSESGFDERGEGRFLGRVETYQLDEGIWLSLRDHGADGKDVKREIVFPLLDANGSAHDPEEDPFASQRNGPFQSVLLSDMEFDNWNTHHELIVPEPLPRERGALQWAHERIVIPLRLGELDPPIFSFVKLDSWRPDAEDLKIVQHGRPGELKGLRMVILFSSASDRALTEAISSLHADGGDGADDESPAIDGGSP